MKNKLIIPIIFFFVCTLLFSCKKEDSKDTTPPQITLLGDNPYTVGMGTNYIDSGVTAIDDIDGDISASVQLTNNVNMSVVGNYTVKYNVSDKAGNSAPEVTRTVKVVITK